MCSVGPETHRRSLLLSGAAARYPRFSVEREQWIRLSIYDVFGREIVRLVDERKRPGSYAAAWTAGDAVSGVYFARLGLRGEPSQESKLLKLQ